MNRRPVSTSIHSLNADHGLGLGGKLAWLTLNVINNARSRADVDPDLQQHDFVVDDVDPRWDGFRRITSPARRLCDLFWEHLPLPAIAAELGGKLNALEVGCGSGIYGAYLVHALGERVHYRGVDIAPNPMWETYRERPNLEFAVASASGVSEHLRDANFIFTQSALEHFDDDMIFLRQIADFVALARHPVIQIHLIPSAGCISTFPWHGIRQYTPRTISKFTRLFTSPADKTLVRLGSARCNALHRRWITIPAYLGGGNKRQAEAERYARDLRDAIRGDMARPAARAACFYALIIKSGISRQPESVDG